MALRTSVLILAVAFVALSFCLDSAAATSRRAVLGRSMRRGNIFSNFVTAITRGDNPPLPDLGLGSDILIDQSKISRPPVLPANSQTAAGLSLITAAFSDWIYKDAFKTLNADDKKAVPVCELEICHEDGWEYEWHHKLDTLSVEFVMVKKGTTHILAFRGSESTTDWAIDASGTFVPAGILKRTVTLVHDAPHCDRCGRIHTGFAMVTKTLLDGLLPKLKALPETDNVVFTGHSLGGAMATLAIASARLTGVVRRENAFIITFGQPAAGDLEFREMVKRVTLPANRIRFETHMPVILDRLPLFDAKDLRDIVTRMPPFPEYGHWDSGSVVWCKCENPIDCNQGMCHKIGKGYGRALRRFPDLLGAARCGPKPSNCPSDNNNGGGGGGDDENDNNNNNNDEENNNDENNDNNEGGGEEEEKPPAVDISKEIRHIHFRSGYTMYSLFDYWQSEPGSAEVNAGGYVDEHKLLPKLIDSLKKAHPNEKLLKPGRKIVSSGYASITGKDRQNEKLSMNRAFAVGCYLIELLRKHGEPEGTVEIAFHGSTRAEPHDEAKRAHDRRVDVFFTDNTEELKLVEMKATWTYGPGKTPEKCSSLKWREDLRWSDRFLDATAIEGNGQGRTLKCKSSSAKIYSSVTASDGNPKSGTCSSAGAPYKATTDPPTIKQFEHYKSEFVQVEGGWIKSKYLSYA